MNAGALGAREEILRRVRAAKGATTPDEARAAYAEIGRGYQQVAGLSREAILDLLEERLREYDAGVYRVRAGAVGEIAARVFAERGVRRVIVPEGLPKEWKQGAEFVEDREFSARELDDFQGVMTACTLGIAETGSIVLQSGPGQGRRAITLVPDYHLCVLRVEDVVETVVEGMRRLERTKDLPTTFFSGPSATADIEMTRIKGVHGPRFVDVFFVEG